jgi:hypothetical protein
MIRNRRLVTEPEIERIPSSDDQECIADSCAPGPGSRQSRPQRDLSPRDPDLLDHMKLLERPDLYSNGSLSSIPLRERLIAGTCLP